MTTDHNCTDHSIPISRGQTQCLICRGRELAAEPDTLVAQLTRRADEMEAIADTAGLRSSWYLEGAAALRKAARDNRRAVKALTAVAPGVRVKPLAWDADGRKLHMDQTMAFSKSYDWDGWDCFRQEGYGLGASYIIWPDSIGSVRWNLYGTIDGLVITDLNGEDAAKAAAQADYEARILAALDTPAPAMGELVEALRGMVNAVGDKPTMTVDQADAIARAVLAKIGGAA